jgi:putative tricarboxylic transport membrane protein
MKKYNNIVSGLFILVGIGMIYFTRNFKYGGLSDIGGGFFPKVIGAILILLSVLQIVDTTRKPEPERTIDFSSIGMKKVLQASVLMMAYCVIIRFLGFMISTGLMVICCMRLMQVRDWKKIFAITVGILVFVEIVFEMILHTQLPGPILIG